MTYSPYLTTTFENPYDYYWKQIHTSLNAMTRKDETKKKYISNFEILLKEKALELGVNIRNKKMYPELCFKACQAVLLEVILTCGKPPHVGYALEYFYYAPTLFDLGENPTAINMDSSTFYNLLLDRLSDTLTSEVNSAILSNNNGGIANNILDLDKLRRYLKQIVATFYLNNPEIKASTNKQPELQNKVRKVFSNIAVEFNKKAAADKTFNF